jgi:hypothetical protein
MSKLFLVGVKMTRRQRTLLDAEVRRRRKTDINASRSSLLREALMRLVGHA